MVGEWENTYIQDDIAKKIRANAKDVLKVICKMLDVDDICLYVAPCQYWTSQGDLVDIAFDAAIFGFNINRGELICKLYNGETALEIPQKYKYNIGKHMGGIWFISEFSRRTSIDEDEFLADIVEMLCRCLASNDGLCAKKTVLNVQPEELLIKTDLNYCV